MKGVYIFLSDGFEDIEALGVRDVLLRGGVDVKLVSITDAYEVVSSRGLTVLSDITLEELTGCPCHAGSANVQTDERDVMVFPGGLPGAEYLGECKALMDLMNEHYREGGSIAAICAAPQHVLRHLEGMGPLKFTCYDGCEAELVAGGAEFLKRPFVVDGRIITGRGPGHALDFGLAVLAHVAGSAVAGKVASGMTLPCDESA